MTKYLKKILDREMYLIYSVFYLFFKYTFFSEGRILTYLMFVYAICIFIYDYYEYRGIYKFSGYIFSYLMCISALLSCIIVAHKINRDAISGISIFFINFFMYLPMFHNKDIGYIKRVFNYIFISILFYSFVINLIGILFAAFGKEIVFFGTQFGSVYGGRLVTVRETANETGWFAIFSLIISVYYVIKLNVIINVRNKKYNTFLIINMLVQMITYVLSKNRSSLIGIIAFMLVLIYMYGKYVGKNVYKKAFWAFLLLAIVLIITYLYFRINDMDSSDLRRYDMIRFGILYLTTVNPIFGSSFVNLHRDLENNFEKIWDKASFKTPKEEISQLIKDANAHNVFIQQIETNGLLGLVILLSFFVFVFKELVKFILSIGTNDELFLEKVFLIFFVVFGFVTGNISQNIVSTITCFVNLMFFLSISAILSLNRFEYIDYNSGIA